jgi:hypothetical protein
MRAARAIPEVPVSVGGERVRLELRAVEPGVVSVEPYPFDRPEILLSVPATAIADQRYDSADALRGAIEGGMPTTLDITLVQAAGR